MVPGARLERSRSGVRKASPEIFRKISGGAGISTGRSHAIEGGGTQKLSDLVTNEKWNPYEKSRMMVAEVDGAVVMAAAVDREVAGWSPEDWVLVGLAEELF